MPQDYRKVHYLFFVEGQTEVEFYKILLRDEFKSISKYIFNLNGNRNIHKRTYGLTLDFLNRNNDSFVKVFCCVDRESRFSSPPLSITEMRNHFSTESRFSNRVISCQKIIATQMIESWFFYDIDGIFKYLRVPKKHRNSKKYTPPEKFTWRELSDLFKRYNKIYIKGEKCSGFIQSLDIVKIKNTCKELERGIDLIRK